MRADDTLGSEGSSLGDGFFLTLSAAFVAFPVTWPFTVPWNWPELV